jgi:DNA-binding transcriptional regulator YbjK
MWFNYIRTLQTESSAMVKRLPSLPPHCPQSDIGLRSRPTICSETLSQARNNVINIFGEMTGKPLKTIDEAVKFARRLEATFAATEAKVAKREVPATMSTIAQGTASASHQDRRPTLRSGTKFRRDESEQQRSKPTNRRASDLTCDFCTRRGHVEDQCVTKSGIAARKKRQTASLNVLTNAAPGMTNAAAGMTTRAFKFTGLQDDLTALIDSGAAASFIRSTVVPDATITEASSEQRFGPS